jgi:hypothetical protein
MHRSLPDQACGAAMMAGGWLMPNRGNKEARLSWREIARVSKDMLSTMADSVPITPERACVLPRMIE